MEIISLKTTGFKQFAEQRQFDFVRGENTVSGDNNQGKTTIAEAVVYAITGRDLFGAVAVDHLLNDHRSEMEVEITFKHKDDVFVLVRSRTQTKKDTVNKLFLNGEKITQAKLDQLIGDYRYFLAAWNPNYIHTLDDAKASELLRSLTTPPAKDVVVAALQLDDQEIAATLEDRDLADPAGAAKKLRAEIKSDNDLITKKLGEAGVYRDQIAQPVPEEMPTFDDQIEDLKKQIAAGEAPPDLDRLKNLRFNREQLLTNYNAIKSAFEKVPAAPTLETAKCPVCEQHLNDYAFTKVTEAWHQNAQQIDGRNATRTKQLKEIVERAQPIAVDIKLIEAALAADPDAGASTNELKMKLDRLNAENQVAKHGNAQRGFILTQKADAEKRLAAVLDEIKTKRDGLPGKDKKIVVLGNYAEKKEELTIGKLAQHFDRLSVKLFKVIKETGELKPSFDLTYDGQAYKNMSNSNRIRAGLELAAAINAITGDNWPTYIDNAEAIGAFNTPAGQYFRAIVQPGADLIVNEQVPEPSADPGVESVHHLPEPTPINKPRSSKEKPKTPAQEMEPLPEFPAIEAPASGPDEGESLLSYHRRMTARIR